MQQPPLPTYLFHPGGYPQDGNNQWGPEVTKGAQYAVAPQWDNNSSGFLTGVSGNPNTYAGQVTAGGGGQSRVQVGPQQPQPPSQPTPTSTPPGIHGDMNKQAAILHNQQQATQMNFVPARTNTMQYQQSYTRSAMAQSQPIRGSRPPHVFVPNVMLTPAQTPLVVNQYPPGAHMPMYSQQRQATPSPYPTGMIFTSSAAAAAAYNHYTNQQYYAGVTSQVLQQPQFQGMPSGGPSPQAGAQQTPVQMMRPAALPLPKHETKKRSRAIKIIDPITNEEVDVDSAANNNNITPTRSNDSSARETPQPNSGVSFADNTVAAEFAAKVARVATDPQVPSSSPDDAEDIISSDSDVHHKQQSNLVPSSEKSYTLSTTSEEFIPRSLKPNPVSEPLAEELRIQQSVVPNVSADTNSPEIEIQRPKEQFPALKTAPPAPASQSPPKVNAKKQKSAENNERQQQANVVLPAPPPTVIDNKDSSVTNKKGGKIVHKEESVPQPSKDKREKARGVSKEQSPATIPAVTPVMSSLPVDVPPLPPMKQTVPSVPVVQPVKDAIKSSVATLPIPVAAEELPAAPQQQNGEIPVAEPPQPPPVDGNKPARGKKGKSNKRDLNRKGAEKEGSDMEAFTTEPIVHEDKERPLTPVSPPPAPVPVKAPMPAFTTPVEPSQEDKIQEDLEEKEDKLLVEARNEENAKVSALSKAEEEPPPIIKKAVPQLTLKRSYKKDQWSPLNQEGKKKYDRDFLLDIKNEPQSQLKPENLPDVVAVISESNVQRNANMNFMINSRDNMNMIMPPFSRNSLSRGPPPKRGSQQGNKVNKNPKVIHMSLSLHEDVKLKTVENAWKPGRLANDPEKPVEDKETEEVYKNVRGILNKLTPQKFDTLMKKFSQIKINSEKRLMGVIDLVFEKAVDEPNFSSSYANMCKTFFKMEVKKEVDGKEESVNFRKLLIMKCQTEFEKNKLELLDGDLEAVNNCTNPEKKKELQLAFEEKERTMRRKSVGNIRFIGELFKLGMLTQNIMYRCIEHLLQDPQEESLECLCKLLTTIGRDLELGSANQQNKPQNPQALNPYFTTMHNLANKKDGSKVSSRVRFMLQDVIDLRLNKWVPRREDNNPKTIEQINKEAERESMEMSMSLNQQPPRMNRPNDRQDDRGKRGSRGNHNNQNEDGWNTVGGSRGGNFHSKFNQPSFDASRISMIKSDAGDITNMNLGGSSTYRFIPGNAGAKNADNKSGVYSSMNVFNALSKVDDRKPSQQQGRRLNQTPSMEKERMRMMQGLDGDRPSSRGSSVHRDRPSSQPPSRDSSIPRHQDNKDVDSLKPKMEEARRPSDEMTSAKWERQVVTIFEEYLGALCSIEDTKQEIQLLPRRKDGELIEKALTLAIEKKTGVQDKLGELICVLMDSDMVSTDLLVESLRNSYEFADDVAIDVPKFWDHQAYFIVPIISTEKINFSHFKSACLPVLKTDTATKLLVPTIKALAHKKGEPFVRRVWDTSNVSLQDFLPPNVDVDAFIKERSLGYLTGEKPISMDQVQQELFKFIKDNQPYEMILNFISENVGEKVKDLNFIRALITAICEACISDSKSLEIIKLKPYEKLIQRYVDGDEARELESLNTVHYLVSRLEHPQGLLMSIFNLFFENGLISNESFLKWRDDGKMLEHKGISVKSLRPLFTALEEAESDDEPS